MDTRSVFVIVGVSFCALTHGQSFSTRNDHRDRMESEAGLFLEPQGDGYQLIEFASDTPNTFHRICFVTIAQNGSATEVRSFGRDSLTYFPGSAAGPQRTTSGELVLFGGTFDAQRYEALFWRIGSALDSLWSVSVFPSASDDATGKMAVGTDDFYNGIGSVWHDSDNGQLFLAKLDTSGNVLWTREYGGPYRDEGWSMDTTSDGGFILGGWAQFSDTNYDAYIIKTDSLGNEEWHRYLGGSYRDGHSNVITTANGEYVNVGKDATDQTFTTTVFKPFAARLNSVGDVIWQRTYGNWNTENELNTAKELPDGAFISCGTYHTGSRTAGALLKFAASGDSLWMRTYVHPPLDSVFSYHTLYDVIQDDEGYFVSCGSTNDGQQDLWVIRVDSFGCLVPGCQQYDNIAERGIDLNVLVYPNPASDRVYISFRSASEPSGEFVLLNSAGQAVRRFTPDGRSTEIDLDISAQPSGLYLLQYTDQNGTRWESKIVKG